MSSSEVMATVSAAMLLGLSSVPHCAAMCGPLCAAVCGRSGGAQAPVRYQLGRMVGYTLAGVIAARFGLALSNLLPAPLTRVLFPTLSAVACILVAYQLWPRATSPASALVTLRTTKGVSAQVASALANDGRAGESSPRKSVGSGVLARLWQVLPRDASVVGFASTLLPCGALAGALLLAAGRGDAFSGGLFMFVFALISGFATALPATLSRWLQLRSRLHMAGLRRTVAALLVALAVVMTAVPLRALWTQPSAATHHGQVAAQSHHSCH